MSNDYGFDDDDGGLEAELERGLGGGGGPFDLSETGRKQQDGGERPLPPRGEGGRFTPRSEAPRAEVGASPPAQPAQPWSPLWLKPEHGVEWAKLPEPFRKMVEQRERETMQGMRDSAHKAKAWEPVEQFFAPYADQLKQDGQTPVQYVSNLLNIDKQYRENPAQTIAMLAQAAGVDLYDLADQLADANSDPRVSHLAQQNAQLQARLDRLESGGRSASQESGIRMVTDWANAKDANGNLLRPYFNEVRTMMQSMAGVDPNLTLDQLYEQATWAHPETRARIQADQRASVTTRARAAAHSPRSAPNGRPQPGVRLSLEEELAAGLDDMGI